ncbi:hypothetical protein F5878DRAFT_656239 [Lentinula raphanica]|uniref:Uncharacterized protein n=1 Tax=Lentinula raphanica TaxID=153919 RepID=A0AA38PJX9_9AGAR|nr:hypothetical protein F5878DRAFT_656239 [Lentinula raphanica]
MEGSFGLSDLFDGGLASYGDSNHSQSASMPDIGLIFQGAGDATFTASSEAEYTALSSQMWDFDLSVFEESNPAGIDTYVPALPMPGNPISVNQSTDLASLLSACSSVAPDNLSSFLPPIPSSTPISPPSQCSAAPVLPLLPSQTRVDHRRLRSKPYSVYPSPSSNVRPVKRNAHFCVAPTFVDFCNVAGVEYDRLVFSDDHSLSLFQRYSTYRSIRDTLSRLGLVRGVTWKTLALVTVTFSDDHEETLADILHSCNWRARTWDDKVAYFEWAEQARDWSWNYERYPSSPMVYGKDYVAGGDMFNHWQRIKYAWDFPGYFLHGVEPRTKLAGGTEMEACTAELKQETLKRKRLTIIPFLIKASD